MYLLGNFLNDALFGVAPHDDSLQGLQLGQRLQQELDLVLVDKADSCLRVVDRVLHSVLAQ